MRKKRDYKQEYKTQKARGEHADRMERQDARRTVDEKDTGKRTVASSKRKGKDISHNKMLSKGGSNKDGYKLEAPGKNRSRNGQKPKKKK